MDTRAQMVHMSAVARSSIPVSLIFTLALSCIPFCRIVGSFAFQPIRVPNVILVLFVKFIIWHRERPVPEYNRFFNGEAQHLASSVHTLILTRREH